MLKFNSKKHVKDYFNFLDSLDEEQTIQLENTLNFKSLQSEYDSLKSLNSKYKENLKFVIEDPYLTRVLNTYKEFWVGDKIYKYIDKYLVTTGNSSRINDFIEMRSSKEIVRDSLQVFDDANHKELFKRKPQDDEVGSGIYYPNQIGTSRSACEFEIIKTQRSSGNSLWIKVIGLDQNNNEIINCGNNSTFDIDWGDGSTQLFATKVLFGAEFNHIYNNVLPGNCAEFNIKIKINNIGSCGCGLTKNISSKIDICSNVGCTKCEDSADWFVDKYNNGIGLNAYTIVLTQGYNLNDYIWHDARAWGKMEKIDATGNYVAFMSHFRIHGAWFKTSCGGIRVDVNEADDYDKKCPKFEIYYDDYDMVLRSDDRLFCTYTERINAFQSNQIGPPRPFFPHP